MIQLKSFQFFVLICVINKFVLANDRYEHISRFHSLYHSNGRSVILELFCGENNIDRYLFYGDNLLEEANNLISKLSFTEISFQNCRLNEIQHDFFKEFKNVNILNVTDVYLEKLDKFNFQNAKYLKKLVASNNQLTEIPAHLFSNSPAIGQLDFSNNSIHHIDPFAFEGATQLEILNLSYNKISELKPHWLSLNNILTLDLSHNDLKQLNEHAFDKLISLMHLNLSYNPVENLEIGTFAYLTNLETLSLKRTNLISIKMGTFLHQHKLISLDLSESNLKTVDFELLWPILYDLRSFHLNQNQLIDLSGFRNAIFPQLALLDIRDNQFNCTYLRSFIERIDWSKLHLPINPQSINIHESSIRGVHCKNVSLPETWQPNTGSNMGGIGKIDGNATVQLEKLIELTSKAFEQIHNDNNLIKMLLVSVFMCIIVLALLTLFLIFCRTSKL